MRAAKYDFVSVFVMQAHKRKTAEKGGAWEKTERWETSTVSTHDNILSHTIYTPQGRKSSVYTSVMVVLSADSHV